MSELIRCSWCGSDPLYMDYHDQVWGKPVYDDHELFAKLILDGAQAGLSWITILRKMDNYYEAFDGLNPEIMATYDDAKIEQILQNEGIIRNRLKVNAARTNAQAFLKLVEEQSFSDYLWGFVDNQPIINQWDSLSEVPASTDISIALSKDLQKRGFKFVGPTIIYAFMQAVGMVNDHMQNCSFRF